MSDREDYYTLIRKPRLKAMTGLSNSSIHLRQSKASRYFDPTFPRPVALSASGRGAVAYVLGEVEEWIQSRMASR